MQERVKPYLSLEVQFVEGQPYRIVQEDGIISSHSPEDSFYGPE